MKFRDFCRNLQEGAFSRLSAQKLQAQEAYDAGFKAARESGRTFVKSIPVPEYWMINLKDFKQGFIDGLSSNRKLMS